MKCDYEYKKLTTETDLTVEVEDIGFVVLSDSPLYYIILYAERTERT